ncbi:hypothetical protein VNI00_011944 [Paramarasmius palmivorus]|uniref:Exonuclease domain-containing protein n=1 Tax=Paramarasmius palmivorus TaxID=297713 RepID=A0AAW0CA77_9AGAR
MSNKRPRLDEETELQHEPDPVERMMFYYLQSCSLEQRDAVRRRIYEIERNEHIKSFVTNDLILTRPLVAFDLETTSLYPPGGPAPYILSMSFIKILPDKQIRVFSTGNLRSWDGSVYVRCTEPSHPTALKMHGIEPEHTKDLRSFEELSQDVYKFIRGCDVTGFNIAGFDIRVLTEEFKRVGITWKPLCVVDTMYLYNVVYQKRGTLGDAHKEFVGEYFVGAHNAEADAIAALRLLYSMVAKEKKIQRTVEHILRPVPRRPLGPTQSLPAVLG